MDTQPDPRPTSLDDIPFGQRFFDNWPLLMILGIVIMAVIYTGWGLWEIASMPEGALP